MDFSSKKYFVFYLLLNLISRSILDTSITSPEDDISDAPDIEIDDSLKNEGDDEPAQEKVRPVFIRKLRNSKIAILWMIRIILFQTKSLRNQIIKRRQRKSLISATR